MQATGVNQDSYLLDGVAHGDDIQEFGATNYDSGLWRPYKDRNGNHCVDVFVGNHYDPKKGQVVKTYEKMTLREARFRGFDAPTLGVTNANILRKDEWIAFDRAVVTAARQRLRAWSDLAAANTHTMDGMSAEILEHETVNDPGEAHVDMTGISEGRTDQTLFQLEGLPLPFTYSSFFFPERKLNISRKMGQPLSTLAADFAGRRVAETIEKTTIGVTTGITYGTTANYGRAPTVYGYVSHPARNYGTNLTTPTGSNPDTTLSEVLTMRATLYTDGFYGPYVMYNGSDWDVYLDNDYLVSSTGLSTRTLRERLRAIDDIQDVRRLDYLTPTNTGGTFDMIMVSLGNPMVARAVIGMPIRLIQWPTMGGAKLNFRVICIMAPQIRADYNGNSGINHESVT